jgi:hypothetical protein
MKRDLLLTLAVAALFVAGWAATALYLRHLGVT